MNKVILLFCVITLSACSSNQFSVHYNDEGLSSSEFVPLQLNEQVKIIETFNVDKKVKEYQKQGYVVLGTAKFNGYWEPFSSAISVAKDKGATLVIIGTTNLGTEIKSYTAVIPHTNTVYHSGSINSYGYGGGYSSYSGTSTYTTMNYVSGTYSIAKFNQNAFFMAKATKGEK